MILTILEIPLGPILSIVFLSPLFHRKDAKEKEDLTNINETIRSIQKDIGKKSDENLSEQNINKAVDLAKLGVDIKEISSKTGLSEEQIETLIKFHTEK